MQSPKKMKLIFLIILRLMHKQYPRLSDKSLNLLKGTLTRSRSKRKTKRSALSTNSKRDPILLQMVKSNLKNCQLPIPEGNQEGNHDKMLKYPLESKQSNP